MKKKIIALALCLTLIASIVCLFAGCGDNKVDNTKESLQAVVDGVNSGDETATMLKDVDYVKNNGKMIIGITEYAPMNYKDADGNWTGFDTEFAELVCEKLGVEAEFFVIGDWGQKVNELNSKNIDCVWNGMTITDDLKQTMSISDPYVINAQVIVTKEANAEKYATAEDLAGATVAVESGSAGEKEAIAAGLNTVAVAAQSDALKEVKAGTADACIIDITMAKAMTGEGTSYEALTYTGSLSEEYYGIGFRKNSDLAPEVQKIIEELKADGTLDALAAKYNLALAD